LTQARGHDFAVKLFQHLSLDKETFPVDGGGRPHGSRLQENFEEFL
jgi:hypothetical protein